MLRFLPIDLLGRQMIMTTITNANLQAFQQSGTIGINPPGLSDQLTFLAQLD